MKTLHSHSPEQTKDIAQALAKEAKAGDVYVLSGDLGAGKTVFAKGIALGLGIESLITSPTFTIVNTYTDGRLPLYHMDAYRIGNLWEMDDTGYEDYFGGDGLCLVEWAENIAPLLPAQVVYICITKDLAQGEDYRRITIEEKNSEDIGH